MSYDILLFDADRTLYDFDASEKLAFFEVTASYGINASEQDYELYRKINHQNWEDLEKGLAKKEVIVVRRFEQFLQAINFSADAKKMNEDYLTSLSEKSILFDDALPLVKMLKDAGKRIFIVTNGVTKVQVGRMENSPLRPYIERIFISEQMGVSKPQKLFFDLVEKEISGFTKERAIVIGDSLTSDIQGANNASLDCIWLNQEQAPLKEGLKVTFIATSLAKVGEFLLKN